MKSTNFIVLTVLIAVLVGGNYLFAAVPGWEDPTGPPPTNNVDTPINVGTGDQFKDGTLGVVNQLVENQFKVAYRNYAAAGNPITCWTLLANNGLGHISNFINVDPPGSPTNSSPDPVFDTDGGAYQARFYTGSNKYKMNIAESTGVAGDPITWKTAIDIGPDQVKIKDLSVCSTILLGECVDIDLNMMKIPPNCVGSDKALGWDASIAPNGGWVCNEIINGYAGCNPTDGVNLVNCFHTEAECIAAGGTVFTAGTVGVGAVKACRFDNGGTGINATCPAGWTQYHNWGEYSGGGCRGRDSGEDGGSSCTPRSVTFSNTPVSTCSPDSPGGPVKCVAYTTSIGCY